MAETNPAPLRQSCDRCHGQKLRCSRPSGSDTGACNRCLRQGAQCIYSSTLARGRPYTNRRRRTSATASSPKSTLNSGSVGGGSIIRGSHANSWPSETHTHWTNNDLDGKEYDMESMGQMESQAITLDNASGQEFGAFTDIFPGLDVHMSNVDMEFGWPAAIQSYSNNGMTEKSSPRVPPQLQTSLPTKIVGHGASDSIYSADVGIAQLSQLTTSLEPMYLSSCALSESISRQGQDTFARPLFDEHAFMTAATWSFAPDSSLPPASPIASKVRETPGKVLNDAFSAMYSLLQILGRRNSSGLVTRTVSTDGEIDPDFDCRLEQGTSTNTMDRTSPAGVQTPGRQYANTAVRHLVIACHTLILNICVALLVALQQDADLLSSHPPYSTSSSNSPSRIEPAESGADSTTDHILVNMRLVMVVQLTSYLVDRLRKTVDSFLASQNHSNSSSSASSPKSSNQGPNADLEMDVHERLVRLRQTLNM